VSKFIITKITLDVPKRFGRKNQKDLVDELKSRVYSDTDKDSLAYYLQEELSTKKVTILDIKITKVL
jgi:hypothetical protein